MTPSFIAVAALAAIVMAAPPAAVSAAPAVATYPAQGAAGVNPDVRLVLRFPGAPTLGTTGQIRIYDAADDRLVDTLDLAIPAGPAERAAGPYPSYLPAPYDYGGPRRTNADTRAGTPSAPGLPPAGSDYQLSIIGGFTDGFHFHPVIVRADSAIITPHHNLLAYGKTYYVQVDPGVLALDDGSFAGLRGKLAWRFSTRARGPAPDAGRVTVAADGSGDFDTVQGALDFVPEQHARRVTIFVKNGDYEEIVYARNKHGITILGQERDRVRIHYANNEVFNPHPPGVGTNELPGTFPSRRAAFALDHVHDVALVNLTIASTLEGQAEGLLLNGERNLVSDVTVIGAGDALQVNGSTYLQRLRLVGGGDAILGRGPAFFRDCEIESPGPFMWIRNTQANHGNVFVDCAFRARGGALAVLARLPDNKGKNYPYAEAVLLRATLSGIAPPGWGPLDGATAGVRFWEFDSRGADGEPVDTGARHPASRRLDRDRDAALIASYGDPAWVLGGWRPALAPLILRQPQAARAGAAIEVAVAAVPAPRYQWLRDGKPIPGATAARIVARQAGMYAVRVRNAAGTLTSAAVRIAPR
ncbi:carbohydrate esterase [Massilia forsythiae]|uniref:Carbohydrate esterase n=1 Tax=Massilia forsythiae TaxID=2728020 RepID=A0A7Z2VZD5_9BURK|nr:pectinesterase family protein [Massilia forsythiae]QJE01968.1 carbohydrate esterase [Massilia forsythiae]